MITQPEGIEGSWLGFKGNDPLTTHPVESFQPGMTAYLKPGEDVKFNSPQALGGYTAEAPPEAGPKKYDESAASMIALLRYFASSPATMSPDPLSRK
jgi:hypothetical protein